MNEHEAIKFLTENGMPPHDIEHAITHGFSIPDLVDAAKSRLGRGESLREDEAGKPTLICAADVPYEPPRWLIAPYIQRGKGTLIQGDNGTGKTAFACAVAAHVTTGDPLLHGQSTS